MIHEINCNSKIQIHAKNCQFYDFIIIWVTVISKNMYLWSCLFWVLLETFFFFYQGLYLIFDILCTMWVICGIRPMCIILDIVGAKQGCSRIYMFITGKRLWPKLIPDPISHHGLVRLYRSTVTYRSGSTFSQVMACCLTAPSHYLIQCWPIIKGVFFSFALWLFRMKRSWYQSLIVFESYTFEITTISPRGSVSLWSCSDSYTHTSPWVPGTGKYPVCRYCGSWHTQILAALTHCPLDKMPDFFADSIFKCIVFGWRFSCFDAIVLPT